MKKLADKCLVWVVCQKSLPINCHLNNSGIGFADRTAMNEFYDYIRGHARTTPPLPLVHSTLIENFDALARSGEISLQMCPVFKKPLIYCFYGRPAYRSGKKGLKASSSQDFMPVCFVFRSNAVRKSIASVYPFDTGAANFGRFLPHVDPAVLSDFSMGRSLNATKSAVTAFYEGNRSYFEGTPKAGLESQTYSTSAVKNYVNLITMNGETEFDDRRSAFEIIADKPIRLEGNLLAVIAPRQFLGKPNVLHTIEKTWGARAMHYSAIRGTIPSEYVRTVAQKMCDFMEKEGLL